MRSCGGGALSRGPDGFDQSLVRMASLLRSDRTISFALSLAVQKKSCVVWVAGYRRAGIAARQRGRWNNRLWVSGLPVHTLASPPGHTNFFVWDES
jgi:hypothetical protein